MAEASILRAKQVAARLGVSTAAVWYKANPKHRLYDPDFPKPFKVAANTTGWLENEVNDYIQQLAAKRQNTQESAA